MFRYIKTKKVALRGKSRREFSEKTNTINRFKVQNERKQIHNTVNKKRDITTDTEIFFLIIKMPPGTILGPNS